MDGGFSASMLPESIDEPRDLIRLAEALHDYGWSDDNIRAFAHGNWERVLCSTRPPSVSSVSG
jgi:microsomal dipeptidase-like Zn-dependent dipeptidase